MNRITPTERFRKVSSKKQNCYLQIIANIRLLMKSLSVYKTEEQVNTSEAEQDVKNKFNMFLIGCGFHMAETDFGELLDELSNKSRDDGTIPWYHQLTPILMFLSLIVEGKIKLEDLEKYGGLETAIRTHLRHDSIEDFGRSFEKFRDTSLKKVKKKSERLSNEQPNIFNSERKKIEELRTELLVTNLRLMTKKIAILDKFGKPQYHEDGRMVKRSLFRNISDYIHNMLESPHANPVVWIFKIGDGIHNLFSMLGAEKFTPARRLRYANDRENMYGGRDATSDEAMKKWPKFAPAIKAFDAMLGVVLYTNFKYLEYVDIAYDDGRFKEGDTLRKVGIGRYLEGGALNFKIPRAFNPMHMLFDRIKKIAEQDPDPEIKWRASAFLTESLYPALIPFKEYFPCIFSGKHREIGAAYGANGIMPPKVS